jgi:hypothetical protein
VPNVFAATISLNTVASTAIPSTTSLSRAVLAAESAEVAAIFMRGTVLAHAQ